MWAHSGRELFYLGPSEIIAAQLTTEPAFNRGEQRTLFSHGSEYVRGTNYAAYDVSPDDQRFVMIRRTIGGAGQGQDSTRLMFVENWFEELKAKVGSRFASKLKWEPTSTSIISPRRFARH